MLTLLIFFLVIFLVPGLVTRMARASRERAYEEEQRQREELQPNGGGGEQVSPFGIFPFGGILEEMMRGMETRSYRIDPETGEWVDMTDERPPEPEPGPEPAPVGAAPRRAKRKSRTRPKSTSSMSPW